MKRNGAKKERLKHIRKSALGADHIELGDSECCEKSHIKLSFYWALLALLLGIALTFFFFHYCFPNSIFFIFSFLIYSVNIVLMLHIFRFYTTK